MDCAASIYSLIVIEKSVAKHIAARQIVEQMRNGAGIHLRCKENADVFVAV